MNTVHPWQLLLVALAGWLNCQQQDIIDYLALENRILKRQLRGRRLRLTDDERRRLAVKGKALGRRVLQQLATMSRAGPSPTFSRRTASSPPTSEGKEHLGEPS